MFILDGQPQKMEAAPFVTDALGRLRQWFGEVDVTASGVGRAADFHLRLAAPFGSRTYQVQVKPVLTPVSAATVPPGDVLPTLLIAPHISDRVADVLRDRGIDHVDAAGNAWLSWGSALIDVRGRRPAKGPRPRAEDRAARAFTRSGVQVLFVLLAWPELTSQPLRTLAAAAGVSLGSAQIVMDELSAARYLYPAAGARSLTYGRELLDRWAEAYSVSLSPKLTLGRFSGGDGSWWRDPELLAAGVQVGGEAAAEMIDSYLRPATVTLYAGAQPLALLAQHGLRRNEDGAVSVRRRFWTKPEGAPAEPLVPIPLIYADLLATGESRQREHAKRLRGNDARLQRIDQL